MVNIKKISWLSIFLILAMLLVACGGGEAEAPAEEAIPMVMETPEWIKRLRGKSPVGF